MHKNKTCTKCGAKAILNDQCVTCGAIQVPKPPDPDPLQQSNLPHVKGHTGLIVAVSMICDPRDEQEIVRKVKKSLQYLIHIGFITNVKVESEILSEEKTKELGIKNGTS